MAYQALYRKWRPRTFDDMVGQEHITTTLKNQVALHKLSHAYLFCGSRGTGKTSCSKILAKAVNCLNQTNGNPCGTCSVCTGIDNDTLLDVTEIDAASNSGVDNIRELREEANFTPTVAQYRVYIIDETHMLSIGAFNALLKIMEEPPPHVLFILATTELHKVPATILSRCQRFDFHRIASATIAARLEYIAEQEQIRLEPEAAMLIASLADGGMRDALSLLDLTASLTTHVTVSLVRDTAGLADSTYLFDILRAILHNDYAVCFSVLAVLWEQSVDAVQLCGQLATILRDMLVLKNAPNGTDFINTTPEQWGVLEQLAADYPTERILYSLQVLAKARERLGQLGFGRVALEMMLLELCDMTLATTPQALAARVQALEQRPTQPAVVLSPPLESSPGIAEVGKKADKTTTVPIPPNADTVPFAPWGEVLEVLAGKNPALFATLQQSKAYVTGDLLLIDATGSLFAEMIRTDEYAKKTLREAALLVTGNRYKLGPYQSTAYSPEPISGGKLDDLLARAPDMGIEIQYDHS